MFKFTTIHVTKCVFVINSPPKFAPTKVSLYKIQDNCKFLQYFVCAV